MSADVVITTKPRIQLGRAYYNVIIDETGATLHENPNGRYWHTLGVLTRSVTLDAVFTALGERGIVFEASIVRRYEEGPDSWIEVLLPVPCYSHGDRVRVRPENWTGLGARYGCVLTSNRDRTFCRMDDGTVQDFDTHAIEPA